MNHQVPAATEDGVDGPRREGRVGRGEYLQSSVRHHLFFVIGLTLAIGVTVLAPYSALAASRESSEALIREFARNGALTYVIRAPEDGASQSATIPATVESRLVASTSVANVSALYNSDSLATNMSLGSDSHVRDVRVIGISPEVFRLGADLTLSNGRLPGKQESAWAVISHDAARSLGLPNDCTVVDCTIRVQDANFHVVGELDTFTGEFAGGVDQPAVYVDLPTLINLDIVTAPTTLLVQSPALPYWRTQEALERMITDLGPGLKVDAPIAASTVRAGVIDRWGNTLKNLLFGLSGVALCMSALMIAVYVRRREPEITLLRTLGFPPNWCWQELLIEVVLAITGGITIALGTSAALWKLGVFRSVYARDMLIVVTVVTGATALVTFVVSHRAAWQRSRKLSSG